MDYLKIKKKKKKNTWTITNFYNTIADAVL